MFMTFKKRVKEKDLLIEFLNVSFVNDDEVISKHFLTGMELEVVFHKHKPNLTDLLKASVLYKQKLA